MRLVSVCGHFNDEGRIGEIEEFFREHPAPCRGADDPAVHREGAAEQPLVRTGTGGRWRTGSEAEEP